MKKRKTKYKRQYYCVCQASDADNRFYTYKLHTKENAVRWKFKRILTGSHKKCTEFMDANGYSY